MSEQEEQTPRVPGRRWRDAIPAAAPARRRGVPAHGDPALRRAAEVHQGDGNRHGERQVHPARRAALGGQGRSGRGGHVRHRLRFQHPADAEAAGRHREGAGRGRQPRPHRQGDRPAHPLGGGGDPDPGRGHAAPGSRGDAPRAAVGVRPVREAEQEDPAGNPHFAGRASTRPGAWPTRSRRTCRSSSSRSSRCSRCSK